MKNITKPLQKQNLKLRCKDTNNYVSRKLQIETRDRSKYKNDVIDRRL
jgi:hypothetical protein